ncbi:hypothetical protein I79_013603 [Cricetulus griseus]|uniref:Uncharacterized protein n=1 Tax=Cricetulus griseus TaxID=10029 RepID=G3HRX8_CRIGR|nr:hypothetical protein I79_013603 [Cricetulus griseus]
MNCRNLDFIVADEFYTKSSKNGGKALILRCHVLVCGLQQGYVHKLAFLSDKSEKVYQLGNLVFPSTL